MKPQRNHIESYPLHQPPRPVRLAEMRPPAPMEEPMRCVWSGYPNYDRDCRSRIPASVVVKKWQRERQLKGTVEGFFNFAWRSGVWLAFGVEDGSIRGVYCPTHCSERDARETQKMDRQAEGPTGVALQ